MLFRPRFTQPRTLTTRAVSMTAAASGSNGIQVADDGDIDLGTGDFTLHWEGSLPDYTPGSAVALFYKYQNGSNRWWFLLNTNGTIDVLANSGGSTIISADSADAVGSSNGDHVKFTATVVRETASSDGVVTFYVNGSQHGSTTTLSSAAAASLSNTGALNVSGNQNTGARHESITQSARIFNRALSAAEVLSLAQSGIADADKWGSQAPVYESDFSAGVDGFGATRGASAGNIDSIGGEDDWLRLTVNTDNSSHYLGRNNTVTAGKKYRFTYTYFVPSGQTAVDGIQLGTGGGVNGVNRTVLDTATTVTEELEAGSAFLLFIATDGGNQTLSDPGGDDVIYVKNVSITQIGATLALEPTGLDGTNTWTDSSGNGLDATLPAAGAEVVTIAKP